MIGVTVVWSAPGWLPVAALAAVVLLTLLAWGYRGARVNPGVRAAAATLKALGLLILILALLEPVLSRNRARPGANLFIVLADNSQSMKLKDGGSASSRGEELNKLLVSAEQGWLARLRQDFDVREYAFDTQLRPIEGAGTLGFDGGSSDLGASLQRLSRRYRGRPVAGVLLLTDGAATDPDAIDPLLHAPSASADSTGLPPVYPVLIGQVSPAVDVNLAHVAVTQTNFEDAPVTMTARITSTGYVGKTILAQLLDEDGKQVQELKLPVKSDSEPLVARFTMRPEHPGLSFYHVRAVGEGDVQTLDHPESSHEATMANNSRLVAVDRGAGPYRVLYVSGRPNWEFKFLQRAILMDDQVQLVGMIRIAKREPKFSFLGHSGEDANPLFRGFGGTDREQTEQYDQPVIIRLGTIDEAELRDGFPKKAEDLYRYNAVILDDLESEFFTQDQMLLLKEFVRQRGGGLLMLGGEESFKNGKFDRTPIGDLLPVYADDVPTPAPDAQFRLSLTREGWLEPWVRLRSEETDEQQRLASMSPFQTLNEIRGIKPGATVLARVQDQHGASVPALVEQRFGRGRVGALLIGDLWRWQMNRPMNAPADLEKAWKQTVRWLVSEVPRRVEIEIAAPSNTDDLDSSEAMNLSVRVRDPSYEPLDNAKVTIHVTPPDGKPIDLTADASAKEPGVYEAVYVPRQTGAFRASATALMADGSEVGKAESGWVSDPAVEEFRDLKPNRELLDRIASGTGGQSVNAADLDSFIKTLPMRHADVTEPFIEPLWHQTWVFLLAILCLTAEWGIRRVRGLP